MPTSGGPHATLAAEYVSCLRESLGCKVVSCFVVKPEADERARKASNDWIQKTIHRSGLEGKTDLQLIEGENVEYTLARMGGERDLIVLGATKESVFSSVLFGEIPEKVARYSQSPVMIVKRYEGTVKSIINKIFG
jgi:nucleotide-binding universal stress UspA family protein